MSELILSYGYTDADNYDCYCVVNYPEAMLRNIVKNRNEIPAWEWLHKDVDPAHIKWAEEIKDKNPEYYKKLLEQYKRLHKAYELEQSLGDITQYNITVDKWPDEIQNLYLKLNLMRNDLRFYNMHPKAAKRYLYCLSPEAHIDKLKRLLEEVPIKPDWAQEIEAM